MIYIVTTESFPNGMAATQRIRCYAKSISELEQCQVIVANRLEDNTKPLGNVCPNGAIGKYSYRYIGGSTRKLKNRCLSNIFRFSDVLRLIFFLLFSLSKRDSILFYSYSLSLLKIVTQICHIKGAKIFYDLCEHPSIQCVSCPKEEGYDIEWMKHNLGDLDGIIVISHALEELVQNAFNSEMKCLRLPVMFEESIEISKNSTINNGIPYIMHTGSLTQRKDGILDSLKAFSIAVNSAQIDLDYILTGNLNNSPDKEKIIEIIKANHLENRVNFVGYLSSDDMVKYQQNAYMTIINKEDNLQNKYCFATKLGEYLNNGCTLLTTKIGEAPYFLDDNKDCIYFTPGDINGLSNIIIKLANDSVSRNIISEHGKKTAEKFFLCTRYSFKLTEFLKCK